MLKPIKDLGDCETRTKELDQLQENCNWYLTHWDYNTLDEYTKISTMEELFRIVNELISIIKDQHEIQCKQNERGLRNAK